jgi:sigma54-dependent transcription regulator
MASEVTKSITAENTFSDEITVQGYFNISVTGIAGGTEVTVQKISGVDGSNYTDVDSFTADVETYGFDPERQNYRVGVKTGDFGSGTCKVRLGCKWIDYLSS